MNPSGCLQSRQVGRKLVDKVPNFVHNSLGWGMLEPLHEVWIAVPWWKRSKGDRFGGFDQQRGKKTKQKGKRLANSSDSQSLPKVPSSRKLFQKTWKTLFLCAISSKIRHPDSRGTTPSDVPPFSPSPSTSMPASANLASTSGPAMASGFGGDKILLHFCHVWKNICNKHNPLHCCCRTKVAKVGCWKL